jgi:hypothetical protein
MRMTGKTINALDPKLIREFIGGGDLTKVEVLDQIEFKDTDECAWKKDDDGIWRCHPIEGRRIWKLQWSLRDGGHDVDSPRWREL